MNFRQFNSIVEIKTKIISMGTFFSATLFALYSKGELSFSRFLIILFSVLFVDMGTTGFNSYFDFVNGTDNKKFNKEESKVLVHEHVKPTTALFVSSVLFFLAAILGLILAFQTSFLLIVVGSVCMCVGYLYTAGPFPISRSPFGELFAGGFLGTVLFLITFYVHTLILNTTAFLVSLPFLILIGMILTVNNRCDKTSDREAGRKTLAILLSEKAIKRVMDFQIVSPFLLTVFYSLIGFLPLWVAVFTVVAFILSWFVYQKMENSGFSLETKEVSMASVSKIFLLYCLSFIVGLLFAIVL
ncbi:MAG: prenyltransferase [Sphaerochaetaceae bacterium]